MGASAVDIITYIGVPLAVLGVLPTLYTCLKSLLTLRDIRKLLDRNGVAAITRSSLLSGIIEVEIPRKSLIPLDREDPPYFELSDTPSGLKGGSWTTLNWRELSIGVKGYRFQYHDELCQPQAEVDFENLVAFLLDLGAVPSQEGFADLRSSGLWTPAGTKLMLSPCTADAVLSVTTSEDSDGILALALEWRSEWNKRCINDLPPYWMKLSPPIEIELPRIECEKPKGEEENEVEKDENNPFEESNEASSSKEVDEKTPEAIVTSKRYSTAEHLGPEDNRHKRNQSASSHLSVASIQSHHKRSLSIISFKPSLTDAIRLRLGPQGLEEASYESLPAKKLRLAHLRAHHNEPPSPVTMWFAIAATALSAPRGGLWSYQIPDSVIALSRRDSIPGGVLVLLELIAEESVPAWRTPYDDKMEKHEAWVKQQKRIQAQMAEISLSPAERQERWFARMKTENFEREAERKKKLVEDELKQETVVREALSSQRVSMSVVAEACKLFLVKEGVINSESTTHDVAERVLWAMVSSEDVAKKMAIMLDAWWRWAEGGGMTKLHYEMVGEEKVFFAYSACILCIVKDNAGVGGNIVSDLQESLRMWKKVRLG